MIAIDRSVLLSIVANLTGVNTVWDRDPTPMVSPLTRARVELKTSATATKGVDETRVAYNAGTDQLEETLSGLRDFVLTVKAESYDPAIQAYDIVESLRTRIRRDSQRALLHAAGLALISFETIHDLPTSYDNRVISACAMDIHMAAAINDPTGENTDYIGTVNGNDVVPGNLT